MKNKNNKSLSLKDFPIHIGKPTPEQLSIEHQLEDWLNVSRYSYAPNTLVAFKQDWEIFFNWCAHHKDTETGQGYPLHALPASPETVIHFIQSQIGYKSPATIRRYLSTISKIHKAVDVKNPLNNELVITAKKEIGRGRVRPEHINRPHHNLAGNQRQAKGLNWSHLIKIKELMPVSNLADTAGLSPRQAQLCRRQNGIWFKNARDRALIHLAYDSLLRVSEITALTTDKIQYHSDGSALLEIGKRKDNQEGEIEMAYLAPDTVKEIVRWLSMSQISSGPLFSSITKSASTRKDKISGIQKPLRTTNVLTLYKNIADKIGESPALFSCHSTRVGATQDMLEENIGMLAVKQAGRWKSDRMPSRYAKDIEARRGGMAQLSMKKNR